MLLTNVSPTRGHVRPENAARRYGSLRAKDIANLRAFNVIRAARSVTIFSYPAPSTHRPEPYGPNSPKALSKKAISFPDVADVHSMLDSRVSQYRAFRAHQPRWIVAPTTPSDNQGTRDRTHGVPDLPPRPFSLVAGRAASCPTHCGNDAPACQGRETTCTSNVRVSENLSIGTRSRTQNAQKNCSVVAHRASVE
jgi:hypothetical protein